MESLYFGVLCQGVGSVRSARGNAGMHTFHAFSPDTVEDYEGLSQKEYDALKEKRADAIIDRLERACFPGLRDAITFREV